MDYFKKIITDIELHAAEGIRECFENGVDPNAVFKDRPLIYELISEYTRSARFKDCVKAFIDYGLNFSDKVLLAVLLNDAGSLTSALSKDAEAVHKRYTLRCAYTPLYEATLLHICAEFNHVSCAEVLVKNGADINAAAGFDEYGFGGQTPIFHTVNQNSNQSIDMLNYLLSQSVDLERTIAGLIWGKGYQWETLLPAVNPISYSMMGLLPQMQRNENTISNTVLLLLQKRYGINYKPVNVPCAYLK
jgi:ankyrin repeat protein